MILDQEKITKIKILLKSRPKGLTISDISQMLKMNRNSIAKYLEILLITGQVEMRLYGNAKVYYLSQRVPLSSMLRFATEMILVLDNDLKIIEVNDNLLSFFHLTRDELVGEKITRTTLPFPGTEYLLAPAEAEGAGEVTKELELTRDSIKKFLKLKIIPTVFDDGGRGVTLILEDITAEKEYEQKLKQSEAQYRAVVEDQTEMICRFGPDLLLTFVNEAACRYIGLSRQELIGKKFMDFMLPEFQQNIRESLLALNPENPEYSDESQVVLPDGTIRWNHWTNHAICNDLGHIIEFQAVGQDITDRKASEREIFIKNQAIDSSVNGIAIADLSGTMTYVNRAFLAMFGYEHESELIGKCLRILSHDDEHEGYTINEVMDALMKSGRWTGETKPRRKDQSTFHAHLSATLVLDKSGSPLCLMASFIDITEIKSMRREMHLKDTAIASSINAVAILDAEQRFLYANRAFLEMLGYTDLDDLLGHPARDITRDVELLQPDLAEIVEYLRRDGRWTGEIRSKRRGEEVRYVQFSGNVVMDESGRVLYTMVSLIEITDQKMIERTLQSTIDKLQDTIEFMPDPTFIIDRNGSVIAWNKALESLSGTRREDIIGSNEYGRAFAFFEGTRPVLVDILDLPVHELAQNYPSARKFGDSIFIEATIPGLNGGKGGILWGKASPLIDQEGNIIGAIESMRDISAWKKARETRREPEGPLAEDTPDRPATEREAADRGMRRLAAVLDLIPDPVVVFDGSGRIQNTNTAFLELVQGNREVIIGAHLSIFLGKGRYRALQDACQGAGDACSMQLEILDLSGKPVLAADARLARLDPQGPEPGEKVLILHQAPGSDA